MPRTVFLYSLFFLSGAAGLLYQVMWMKELSLLFGSTSQSSAVTVAAFFLGLGLGAQYFGKRMKNQGLKYLSFSASPLKMYMCLELAIGASALAYFFIFPLFNSIYLGAFHTLIENPMLLLLLKLLLSVGLLSIPAFFMGGTLPVMSELVVRSQQTFGKNVAGIYFINTFGACAGAIAGGFWLPQSFGFTTTYIIAISTSLLLAVATFVYWKLSGSEPIVKTNVASRTQQAKKLVLPKYIVLIAAWSGLASIALQILWTRLFSQVLQNSTYTFSAILAVFLLALSLGSLIAHWLAGVRHSRSVLAMLLLLSGLSVALTPSLYMHFTHDMSYVGGKSDFVAYLFEVLGVVALTIGPAIVCMGVCLPYLYKLMEKSVGQQYAEVVGRVNSINTYAGIIGSLLAGFVLFHWLGTWQAIYSVALLYMLAGVFLLREEKLSNTHYTGVFVVTLLIVLLNPSKLVTVPFDPIVKKERVLEYWEGDAGTVAVVDKDGNLKTKLNNWYALGGSNAKRTESLQTHLPVNLHGEPKSLFYLGLGTGITAGTALNYPIEKVVVAELVEEVITASSRYFSEHTNGLFDDPRVKVINEDGRQYLQGTKEQFDLIIADLFVPWRAGVSNLYALEHYENAKQRLNEAGYYVQWIPLYQVSKEEFTVIAKTMKQVFPQVTAWRGDFYAQKPIMALIGHKSSGQLNRQSLLLKTSVQIASQYQEKGQVPLLSHFVGSIEQAQPFLQDAPINTDDLPVIAYMAPKSHRANKSGKSQRFIGPQLLDAMHQMRNPDDPYLVGLTEQELSVLYAGYFLHAGQIAKSIKQIDAQVRAMQQFRDLMIGNSNISK